MLVLSRRIGERIAIGDDTFLIVRSISGGRVRLAVQAPSQTPILRGELTVRTTTSYVEPDVPPQRIGSNGRIVASLPDFNPLSRVNNG
jgi:carbon storage regulator